jgi:hypothetical protein
MLIWGFLQPSSSRDGRHRFNCSLSFEKADLVARLGRALASLSGKVDSLDVRRGVAALTSQMESASPVETKLLAELGEALAGLKDKLNAAELRIGTTVLAARMSRIYNSHFDYYEDAAGSATGKLC